MIQKDYQYKDFKKKKNYNINNLEGTFPSFSSKNETI